MLRQAVRCPRVCDARSPTGRCLFLLVCCLGLAGCGRAQPAAPVIQAQPAEARPRRPPHRAGPREGQPTRTLTQDLGLVRPGQAVRRRFTVTNDSGNRWTLAALHSDCNCTAGRPLSDVVLPGKCVEVEVEYRALPVTVDDVHRVGVEFVEKDAPWVWLEIRACVREPIGLFPPEVTMRPAGPGHRETSFEVHNFSERKVRLLSVEPSAPWLTARPAAVAPSAGHGPARQAWRINLRAKAEGLPAGRHQAQVVIRTDCPDAPLKSVPVELDLRAPVQAAPDRLAFGVVAPGTPARRRVVLRYPPGGAPSGLTGVAVSHTLGEQLRVEYERASGTQGILSAVLTPAKNAGEEVRGTVLIEFGSGELPPLEIPVSARVQRP